MTFGQVKSIIETSLIESYKNESDFKKSLKEFKHNVLSNKTMSKVYSLYDQLTTPQGLSESDAKDFLDEGINIIQKLLKDIKDYEVGQFVDCSISSVDTATLKIQLTEI